MQPDDTTAAEPALRQLEAFRRRNDYDTAHTFASAVDQHGNLLLRAAPQGLSPAPVDARR